MQLLLHGTLDVPFEVTNAGLGVEKQTLLAVMRIPLPPVTPVKHVTMTREVRIKPVGHLRTVEVKPRRDPVNVSSLGHSRLGLLVDALDRVLEVARPGGGAEERTTGALVRNSPAVDAAGILSAATGVVGEIGPRLSIA